MFPIGRKSDGTPPAIVFLFLRHRIVKGLQDNPSRSGFMRKGDPDIVSIAGMHQLPQAGHIRTGTVDQQRSTGTSDVNRALGHQVHAAAAGIRRTDRVWRSSRDAWELPKVVTCSCLHRTRCKSPFPASRRQELCTAGRP